ncbi:MAG: M67 family metallopeptidase [Tannerellaceae bacterium]|nr:M67 family metallopeptidase [Tannerellaceae bacterium]
MKIKRDIVDQIIAQAKAELPAEACGYLLGKKGIITYNYPMTNIDHSPEHFSFSPEEQFAAVRYARQENLDILANWHSHPVSPARPSREDIRLAYDPEILYLILSLETAEPVLNAFHIQESEVTKIELEIL